MFINLKGLKMGKFRCKKGAQPPVSAQIFSAFVFAAALALAFATEKINEDSWTDPDYSAASSNVSPQVHPRWKRDLTGDLFDTAGQLGIGGSYFRKFRALLEGTPPTVKEAFLGGDFSNVTENDIRGMNVSVLEYVPTKLIEKMTKSTAGMALLTPFIEKFLDFNRPNALGRLMGVAADKMKPADLLVKVKEHGGSGEQKNEAANVLLYSALSRLGESPDGITTNNLRTLLNDNLLQLVPEEQLMKVKDSQAAKFLLNRFYAKASGKDHDDVDDKALMYQLANSAYGKAESWTSETITEIGKTPAILSIIPAAALKGLSPETVMQSISTLRNTKFENPLQGKSITDIFLEKSGLEKDEEGNFKKGSQSTLSSAIQNLGNLAAFVNPSLSDSPDIMSTIINSCDQLNLPAPVDAVKKFFQSKTKGKKLADLEVDDFKDMGISALKNGPPELLNSALQTQSLNTDDLKMLGNLKSDSGGFFNTFLKGLFAQVASYAVQQFTKSGRIDFSDLPGAFMGALGIRNVNNMNNRQIQEAIEQFKSNPDAFDAAQKAALLKKLRDAGLVDKDLPPELRSLIPRRNIDDLPDGILDGLPSDSELRLAHGTGKKITAEALEKDKSLVGTLTPKQVAEIDLADIPGVLAAVRKSKDGPQPQTLKALSLRFKEYIQVKSEDYESPDKKLLKHISAAEISKLPATVLAYFVDPRQTRKLPADVRKEIMIALGELSTKDHASIPAKTREEIILQGLAALDAKLDAEKKLGVPELAAIGTAVVDLPPERIASLTPVAFEQAMEIVQGTADDDDDGLKQRACLSPQQRKAWRDKIISQYGRTESWEPATVTTLCCSLALLDEDDLHLIDKEAILTCNCPSDDDAPSHLRDVKQSLIANCKHETGVDLNEPKRTLERVKSEADVTFDFDDLESQIITRRKREAETTGPLSCYLVRIIGSTKPFDAEQLGSIPDKDIHTCIYELGKDELSPEVAKTLWEKLAKNKNGVENIAPSDFIYAGHILSGVRQEDISKLDLANPDVASSFGRRLGLSKNMLEKLASHFEEKTGRAPSEFTTTDLVAAKNILCGFTPDKLLQIQSEAFLEALPVLKDAIDPQCERTRLAALAAVLAREDVRGDPHKWTSADVRGAGVLLNGMISEVTGIPADAFLGITSEVAMNLHESVLANLNPDQLSYVPRFSAQSLSEEQVSGLSAEAQNALDLRGPVVTDSSVKTENSVLISCTLALFTIVAARVL